MVDILVVVLNYNTKKLTGECLESVFSCKSEINLKVVVVDNNSSDGSVSYLKARFPRAFFIESKKNLGFAGGNNLALRRFYKIAKYCLLLNSDTKVEQGFFDNLFSFVEKNGFDIASPKVLNPDLSFQPNGGRLPLFPPLFFWLSGLDDISRKLGISLPSYQARDVEFYIGSSEIGWLAGTALMIKSKVFDKIGFLDDNIFMYGEDVEFCLRARKAGFRLGWTDSAKVIHYGGGSLAEPHFSQWLGEFKGLLYLYRKHYGVLSAFVLKFLIYFFVFLRIFAFYFIGRVDYAKVYAKILKHI